VPLLQLVVLTCQLLEPRCAPREQPFRLLQRLARGADGNSWGLELPAAVEQLGAMHAQRGRRALLVVE
jgi:hypothetical protein